MKTNVLNVNVEEVIGHFVEAELTLSGSFRKVEKTLTGRIIYSGYNASLFFKPKNSKNKGYIIENESDIHSVNIIRKDNKNHKLYKEAYQNKEEFENELNKRLEEEKIRKQEQARLRQEQFELERQKKKDQEQKEIEEAKSLGNYDELEKEVINFYQSFENEFFNENFVKTIVVPVLNKLVNKGIESVNDYPKHYFDKKRNHKFCAMIEKKLDLKLKNTQKGNVELLNNYLAS